MDIYMVRNVNARALAARFATISEFSDHVGINRNRASSLLSTSTSSRNIGSKTARQLENRCGKPYGWLDIIHSCVLTSDISDEEIAIQFSLLFSEISGITEKFCSGTMSREQIMKCLIALIEAVHSARCNAE